MAMMAAIATISPVACGPGDQKLLQPAKSKRTKRQMDAADADIFMRDDGSRRITTLTSVAASNRGREIWIVLALTKQAGTAIMMMLPRVMPHAREPRGRPCDAVENKNPPDERKARTHDAR